MFLCLAEESDYATEYEEDGMDTVREEEGEEEEEEDGEDPEDQSPGEWGSNGIFTTVSIYTHNLLYIALKVNTVTNHITGEIKNIFV